jgi:hypothetical protein
MSKPEWKDAPKWASWLAQDGNGDYAWYEEKPVADEESKSWEWVNAATTEWKLADRTTELSEGWRDTLEHRP